jgi:hypothetical protein
VADGSSIALARLQFLWDSRCLLFRVAASGLVASTIIALLIPAKYDWVTQLMPPDNDTSGTAMLAAIASKGGDALSGYASNLLGIRSFGALFVGILRSRTVQDGGRLRDGTRPPCRAARLYDSIQLTRSRSEG